MSLFVSISFVVMNKSVSNKIRFAVQDAIGSVVSNKEQQPSGKNNYEKLI